MCTLTTDEGAIYSGRRWIIDSHWLRPEASRFECNVYNRVSDGEKNDYSIKKSTKDYYEAFANTWGQRMIPSLNMSPTKTSGYTKTLQCGN